MFTYRLNRLFHPVSGRCLNVAVDHGLFGEPLFLTGIEAYPYARCMRYSRLGGSKTVSE